jgi:hypothetical protein
MTPTIPSLFGTQNLDNERAAEIVRNYAKQQEILEKQLLNLQQRPTVSLPSSVAANKPRVVGRYNPGRGSYKQRIESPRASWETVDLW